VPGPSASPRFARHAIVVILILGAWFRLSGISVGLPYSINNDEHNVMNRAFDMVQTGSLDPKGFYDYPTLSMYVQLPVIAARFLVGKARGEWHAFSDPAVWPGPFYLWCRILTALLSVATIFITYRAATRWSIGAALFAALLLAVQPDLAQWAHYVLTDTPTTFFVALAMLFSIRAAETARWPWFLLAGAAAGLAAATKYNGALAVLLPLSALFALPSGPAARGRLVASTAAVAAGAAAAFLLAAPYTVLDWPAFLHGFRDLLSHYPPPAEAKYDIYLKHIRNAMIWPGLRSPFGAALAAAPAFLLLIAGFLAIAWRLRARTSRGAALAVLLFPIAYLWFVSNKGGPTMSFARYQLVIWPPLAIWFGVGAVAVRDLIAGSATPAVWRRLVVAGLLLVLAVPAYHAYDVTRSVGISTAQQAGDWIVQHVRPTEFVMVEDDWINLPPRFSHDHANGLTGESLESYRKKGVAYFIVCSCETEKYFGKPEDHPREVAAYNQIFEATEQVARFPGAFTFTILRMK
jgi:4-amino-4-deoxy-L-arabinose transferase-like glycosyltransferase